MSQPRTKKSTIILRGLRLRCPRCGRGRLFAGWFRMHARCADCDLDFQREPGFYLGSIYINYGITSLIVIAGYMPLWAAKVVSPETLLAGFAAFVVLFPICFFRHARGLWLAFDQIWDPQDGDPRQAT